MTLGPSETVREIPARLSGPGRATSEVDNACKIQGFPSQPSFCIFMEAEQPERSGIRPHPPAKYRKTDPSDSGIVVLNLGAVGLKYHRIGNHIQNAIGSWSLEFLAVLPRHLHDTARSL